MRCLDRSTKRTVFSRVSHDASDLKGTTLTERSFHTFTRTAYFVYYRKTPGATILPL